MVIKHFHINGMTCANCQNRIESRLKNLKGVKKICVSYQTGIANIKFDEDVTSFERIEKEIEELGYDVLNESKAGMTNVIRTICILAIMIALYSVLQQFGVLNFLVPSRLADNSMGYGMLFVVGLLTSVHCIAMCGAINLSQCIPNVGNGDIVRKGTAYLPAVFYNLGRVVSYTVIGSLLGLVGWLIGGNSSVGVPTFLQGILKVIAGILMVIMGINMLGLFPWLRRVDIRMPAFITKRLEKKKSAATRPFTVGLLNGLMPCGPLQSMQILALASANPFTGAFSMLLFSLGSVPLMLGFGTMVTALGKRFTQTVLNVGAVLVTVLGFVMLAQGGGLSGILSSEMLLYLIIGFSIIGIATIIPFTKRIHQIISVTVAIVFVIAMGGVCQHLNREKLSSDSGAQVVEGVQNVYSTLYPGQYPTITVQTGIPVRWTIDAPEGSINGCNYKMIIQKYNIEYTFQEGENTIEFTPTETGTISYTCWMGMIRGSIVVTEENETNSESSDSASEGNNDDSAISDDAQVITKGEYLVIPTAEITEMATFYPITVDGTSMEVFAIKASDGSIRTAFNTCQMCYTSGRGYYIQEGKYLVCRNCGSRFTAGDVDVVTGGCNPLPILENDKTVTSDFICISYDVLKEHCDYFEYWK